MIPSEHGPQAIVIEEPPGPLDADHGPRGARVWLRDDGGFAEERSVVPSGALEIGYQCNSIYSQRGGL